MTNSTPSTKPQSTNADDESGDTAKENRAALVELLQTTDPRIVEQLKILRSREHGEILVAPPGVAYLVSHWQTAGGRISAAEFIAGRLQLQAGLLLFGEATYDQVKATTAFLNSMGIVVDWIGERNRRLYIQVVEDAVERIAKKEKKTHGEVVVKCIKS